MCGSQCRRNPFSYSPISGFLLYQITFLVSFIPQNLYSDRLSESVSLIPPMSLPFIYLPTTTAPLSHLPLALRCWKPRRFISRFLSCSFPTSLAPYVANVSKQVQRMIPHCITTLTPDDVSKLRFSRPFSFSVPFSPLVLLYAQSASSLFV